MRHKNLSRQTFSSHESTWRKRFLVLLLTRVLELNRCLLIRHENKNPLFYLCSHRALYSEFILICVFYHICIFRTHGIQTFPYAYLLLIRHDRLEKWGQKWQIFVHAEIFWAVNTFSLISLCSRTINRLLFDVVYLTLNWKRTQIITFQKHLL